MMLLSFLYVTKGILNCPSVSIDKTMNFHDQAVSMIRLFPSISPTYSTIPPLRLVVENSIFVSVIKKAPLVVLILSFFSQRITSSGLPVEVAVRTTPPS